MRRPQTKTPFAYYNTATRNRGRNPHRIYIPTNRPAMHATWLFVQGPGGTNFTAFSKDGTNWWATAVLFASDFTAMKISGAPGEIWNGDWWEWPAQLKPTWASLPFSIGGYFKGPWGPCTLPILDSFVS